MPEAIGADAMSRFAYYGQKLGQSSMSAKVTTAEYTSLIVAKLSDLNAEIWYTSG